MKKLIYTFIYLSFILNCSYGQVIAPSINKEWTANSYAEFSNYLDELSTLEYPTLSNNEDLLNKAINSISQPLLKNKDLSLDVRMFEAINLQTAVNQILMKYYNAHVSGKNYSTELSYFIGLSLSVCNQAIGVLDEFIQTLDPSDQKYKVQMEGLKKMRSGTATQIDGALISIGETKNFTEEERKIMVLYLAENAVEILNFVDQEYKKEFALKLKKHISNESNLEIKERLRPLLILLNK